MQVSRLLTTEKALHGVKMFKYKSFGAILFVLLATVAGFMAMYLRLLTEQQGVKTLQTIGKVGVDFGSIYIDMLSLDILFNNRGDATLPLVASAGDIGPMLDTLIKDCKNLQVGGQPALATCSQH